MDRPLDAVVIPASEFPHLLGASLSEVHLYVYDGSGFDPIPFQIDENRDWDLVQENLSGSNDCPTKSPQLENASICENNLAFTLEGDPGNDDTGAGLDGDDELVFMARDASPERAPFGTYPPATIVDEYYEIMIRDLRKTGSELPRHGRRWAYLVRTTSGPRQYLRHYVEWDSLATDPLCRTLDVNQARVKKACGWARPNTDSVDGFTHHPGLDLRWIGNHTIDAMQFRTAGGGPAEDVLDRYKMRVAPEAGTTGVEESEDTWDTAGCPRMVGLKAYDDSAKTGALGIHRMVQGTQSGFATTRTDRYYGTHLETLIRLRVHDGVPPLRVYPDLVDPDGKAWKVYTRNYTPGSDGEELDVIDGNGLPSGKTPELDPLEVNWNWHLYDLGTEGTFLFAMRDNLAWTEGRTHYYDDGGTASQRPPEDDEGSYGNAGIKWRGESEDMQDLDCLPGPKRFREAELHIVAVDPNRDYTEYLAWLAEPLTVHVTERSRNEAPLPTPVEPCPPELGVSPDPGGYRNELYFETTCLPNTAGYRLYRSVGMGSYTFLGQVDAGAGFVDAKVEPGVTYRYQAHAFNSVGDPGSGSSEVIVTPVDTVPPLPPTDVVAVPLSQGADITWDGSESWDVQGYELAASTVPGGSYLQLLPSLLPGSADGYVVTGLDPNETYYMVIRSVDLAGNVGPYTEEVAVTPLP